MSPIVRYSSSYRKVWDDFVQRSKNGTFLFLRGYMDYHADRFRDYSTMAMDRNGMPIALFPASRSHAELTSHAGLTYGGMVCDETMTTPQALDVFAAWLAFCKDDGIEQITYKTVPSIYHKKPADEDRYALFCSNAKLYRRDVLSVIDLQHSVVMQTRRQRGVKKATRNSIQISEHHEFSGFWSVLERNLMERHGVHPVHTLPEITLLRERFPTNIRLFCASHNASICAGAMLYYALPAIHVQYIASDESAASTGALDLLFWTLIQDNRHSARYFDFGISNENDGKHLNKGLIEFKEGFGARAICHDFYKVSL